MNGSQFEGLFLELIASDLSQFLTGLNRSWRWLKHLHHARVCADLASGSRKKNFWLGGCGFLKKIWAEDDVM